MFHLIGWLIFGLIVGGIARLLVPGRDPMGCLGTMILGVVGAFVGGFLSNLLFGGSLDHPRPVGWIGAIIGGILVLLLYRLAVGRRDVPPP